MLSVADLPRDRYLFSEVYRDSTSYSVKSELLANEELSRLVSVSPGGKELFDSNNKNNFFYHVTNHIMYLIQQVY